MSPGVFFTTMVFVSVGDAPTEQTVTQRLEWPLTLCSRKAPEYRGKASVAKCAWVGGVQWALPEG